MAYGLLRLDVVNASVFDSRDGEGYVELKNNYTANGHLPSRICIDCTTHRVSIKAYKVYDLLETLKTKGVVVDPEVVLGAWDNYWNMTVSLKVYRQLRSIQMADCCLVPTT